ncbi:alpha/beta-hydrolase [Plenodomus tracheiphilus IPT5]|uniref:Alpha/beta-hydrolase n=1 Tax=Plenodomus tracheiphilus IPT5 TaxID=1408161 RepID=A0A6A7AX37_9PLEO|nr:alpha/beta-hydrolase [Plenodomus tracheiphilus IPT5]
MATTTPTPKTKPNNPTILVVPGSFCPPTFYTEFVDALKEKGFPALVVQLPSTRVRVASLGPAGMMEDADVVRRAVEGLIGMGRGVVVLCHSYGGIPTTQALTSLPIKRIIYLTAVIPLLHQNEHEAFPQPPGYLPTPIDGYMHLDALTFAPALLNDIPFEDAYPLALTIRTHSAKAFEEKVTSLAYAPAEGGKCTPVTYVVCERDVIISPERQRELIGRLVESRGEGGVDVRTLDAGHCPHVSVCEQLVGLVGEVALL